MVLCWWQVFEPADGLWGYQLENGSFTGVLGEVQHYKADFSLDLSITAEREEVIDYTIGYHWEPLTFVTSKPQVRALSSAGLSIVGSPRSLRVCGDQWSIDVARLEKDSASRESCTSTSHTLRIIPTPLPATLQLAVRTS